MKKQKPMQLAEFEAALNRSVWEGPLLTKGQRRLALCLLPFVLVALGLLVLIFWPRENLKLACDRVKKSMTPAEVHAIFGRLPDKEERHDMGRVGEFWRKSGMEDPDRTTTSIWNSADGANAGVVFRRGRVAGAHWDPPPPMTMLEKCQRWFRFFNSKYLHT